MGDGLQNIFNGMDTAKNFITDKIDFFKDSVVDFFKNFFINLGEWLKKLFVPTDNNLVYKIKDIINTKFGFFNQINTFFSSLFNYKNYSNDAPSFSINIYGSSYNIIDLSFYAQYRTFIHSLILFFAWVTFLWKTIHTLPKIIGGGGDTNDN